ncbi:hypothetical protein RE474_11440 [Methanolobus sediminis]|uniref:Uncharacterized protein n=1 Tax=Methanolobus sediminis TaxID=3072978 RepID=A0AA51YIM5_9EURY|nr:hypothetical protein [Methanolobus sediminis]WMW24686.1 hypothetical protein RE474_11440 [Methanolobus sediminis]
MKATGVYHKHNYLKYQIFDEMINNHFPRYASPNEIAEMIGLEPEKVRDGLKRYLRYGYVGRRRGKCPIMHKTMWKYRVTMLGIETYIKLHGLYVQGRELNLRKRERGKVPQKIDSYTGLTRAGYERMISEGNDMDNISVDCAEIC